MGQKLDTCPKFVLYLSMHTIHFTIVKCYLTQPLPTKTDWKTVYASDKDTNYLISRLTKDPSPLTEEEICCVHHAYWQHLTEKRISFKNNRLLLLSQSTLLTDFLFSSLFQTHYATPSSLPTMLLEQVPI